MGYESGNINIGEGDLLINAPGDNDFVDAGGCRDASLDIKQKDLQIKIGQVLGAVDQYIIDQEVGFSILMVESTLRNLCIASGISPEEIDTSDPNTDKLKIYGNAVQSVNFMELKYEVPRIHDKTKKIRFIFTRVKAKGTFKVDFNNDKEWIFKLDCMAFPDPNSDPQWLTMEVQYDKIAA